MPFQHRERLATEITLVLCIKAVLLWLLWLSFFQDPLDEHLTPELIERALFGAQGSTITHKGMWP